MQQPTRTRKYAHLLLATTTLGTGLLVAPPAGAAETPGTFGVAAEAPQAITPTSFNVTPINAQNSTFRYDFDLTGVKVNAGDYIDVQARWGNSEDFSNPSFDGATDYLLNYTEEHIRAHNRGSSEDMDALVAALGGNQIKFSASAGSHTTTVASIQDQRGQTIATVTKNDYGFRVVFNEAATAQEDITFSLEAKTELRFGSYGRLQLTDTTPAGLEPGNISKAIVHGDLAAIYDVLPLASPGAHYEATLPYSIYINQEKQLTTEREVSGDLYVKRNRALWNGNGNLVSRSGDASPTLGRINIAYAGNHYASAEDVGNRQTITATINPDTLEYLRLNPDWKGAYRFHIGETTRLPDGRLVSATSDEYAAKYGEKWTDVVSGNQNDPTLWDIRLENFNPENNTIQFSWVPRAEGDHLAFNLFDAVLATTKAASEQKIDGYNFTTTYTHTNAPDQTAKSRSEWYWRASEATGLLFPTANPDESTTKFGAPVTSNLATNDTFPESQIATATITGQPTNGTVTIGNDGNATYTPNPGFVGTDTVTYEVTDGNGKKSTSTWTITVEKPAAPTAADDRFKASFNSGETIEIDPYANDKVPAGSAWDYNAISLSVTEDDNFTYKLSADKKKVLATVKPGRTGVAPAVQYTVQDVYGQAVTASIQGEISAPETSVAITTTINGGEQATVTPNTEVEAKHLVRNTSKFAYPAGTVVTVATNGVAENLTLTEALNPGQEVTLTSKLKVEQKGQTTVTSTITVKVEAADATTDADASVSAGATSTAVAKARVGLIDLIDDKASTIFDQPVEFNILGNDKPEEGFPFLDETFTWVGDGQISEDGKKIVFPNGSYTYLGGGNARWEYAAGTDVVEIPAVRYNVSNALGDTTDPALVTIDSKATPIEAQDDLFTIAFNAVNAAEFNILDNDTVTRGNAVAKVELLNAAGNPATVVEDENFVYTLGEGGKVSAQVKPGRTGTAPSISYRITDRFGQVSEATIQGSIEAPATSTLIESTVEGQEAATVEPGKAYTVAHKVTNTSKFAYVPAGTVIEVEGELVELPATLNPGEVYEFTTEALVEARGEKTVQSRVQVRLDAVDAATGDDASVEAESADSVVLTALTGEIALADDSATILKGGSTSGGLFGNDTQNGDYPFLDDTFRWVLPEGVEGGLSEDGKVVTFPNGVLTYLGEGKYEFAYADGATDFKVPAVQYTVSNLLGDEASPATLTIRFLSVDLEVEIQDDSGEWRDADDVESKVSFSEEKEREHRFTVTNDGEAPLTQVVLKDAQGNPVVVELPETLEPGESAVVTLSLVVEEGLYEADFVVESLEGATDSDPVLAEVIIPEPEPTPEPTPEPEVTPEPKDLESKDTNTAANPFERASGGSALLAGFALLGAAGLAARRRVASLFSREK